MATLQSILEVALKSAASDIHLTCGSPPLLRVYGDVLASPLPVLTEQDTAVIARAMMTDPQWQLLEIRRDVDFSYQPAGAGRLRVNAHFQRGSIALAIRLISTTVRSLESLMLPEAVDRLTCTQRGLILVTGGTGSGKSTTLAAMVQAINQREPGHIITIEDPIEYAFTGDKCCIEQREVGADVTDFASGLRHVLRQDPDVIMVGEMRDLETTRAALTAAETGHLVLSTLHTTSAPQTIDRIIDQYPSGEQNQVRMMLASTLVAVVSQSLIVRKDRSGMIAACELMLCTPGIRNCIRENRTFEIPSAIETGKASGMQSMDASIRNLMVNGYITRENAVANARQPERMAA